MFLKSLLVFCVILNCNIINGQICSKKTVVTKWTYQTFLYTYRDQYSTRNYLGNVIYRTRAKTATGSKPTRTQVDQYVPTCCDGYIRVDSGSLADIDCKPICTPACENGECVSPGECECKEGYLRDFATPHKCFPSCNVCVRGTCVAPNVCECGHGYSLQNGTTCEPICTEPCVNSACVAPDTCQCHNGYRKNSANLCTPYCPSGCFHGTCTAPETCTCDDGWQKAETGDCVPKCNVPCGEGTCTEPNICTCNEGYETDEKHDPICVPQCFNACGNGTCVSPDTCECDAGYKGDIHSEPVCEPFCEIECGNGLCIAPNQCECYSGYKSDGDNNPICVPQCDVACGNGSCVAPDTCECYTGYKLDSHKEPMCVPQCAIKCGNGTCIAPNQCECHLGYIDDTDSIPMCVPKCDVACGNGTCVGPNICKCDAGYESNDDNHPVCVPQCQNNCGNGTCIAPNVCNCYVGYKSVEGKEPNCEPDCGDCEGHCFVSGKCECDEPFKATRVTADGKECDDDINKCTRTVCRIDPTVKPTERVTYGYDDIGTSDNIETRSTTIKNDEPDFYYYDYDGVIVNGSIVKKVENDVENQIQGSEHWILSTWGYAVMAAVALIAVTILGLLVIFRSTIMDCSKGSHYEVDGNPDNKGNAAQGAQTGSIEVRLSTILKNRKERNYV